MCMYKFKYLKYAQILIKYVKTYPPVWLLCYHDPKKWQFLPLLEITISFTFSYLM